MVLSAPPDPAAWQQMREITGFDEQTLHQGYWAPRHAYDRGDLTGLAYWEQVASAGGTTFSTEQVQQLIDADVALWTRLNTPMVEWAQQLQQAGVRTGILSNIGDAMTDGLLSKFDWLQDFHHCVWSYRLRVAKPEATIYRAAAEALATLPEKILFIDDKTENIQAAHEVGMQAIQYNDHESFVREMEQQGFASLLKPGF
jgi:putative hydrolase of the HAD superfamily